MRFQETYIFTEQTLKTNWEDRLQMDVLEFQTAKFNGYYQTLLKEQRFILNHNLLYNIFIVKPWQEH